MATGIEIFGVACNVMQTIGFAFTVVEIYKTIHSGGSVSPETETQSTELARVTGDLQGYLGRLQSRPLLKDDQEIQQVASEVLKTATDLQKELTKYGKNASGSANASVLKTVKFVFRKSKVEKLNERLKSYQSIMETRILVKLSGKSDLVQSILDEGLATVDARLSNFLILLQEGRTKLDELIADTQQIRKELRREGIETRAATKNVVALESSITRAHITSELDAHQSSQILRDQREQILKSLKFESMYVRENASPINQSHEGTFQWIFDDDPESDDESYGMTSRSGRVWSSFPTWLQSEDTFYWIFGKPGSGKSSLMRYLTSYLRTTELLQGRPFARNTKVLRAFIWAAGEPIQRSQKGVIATLLHELLSDETVPMDQCTKRYGWKSSINDWSLKELTEFLQCSLRNSLIPTCIFIDGLDEIDPQEFGGLRGLIKLVNNLAQIPNTKFCLGSRPEPILVVEFSQTPQLRLQDLTKRDMQRHVEESLREVHERHITQKDLEKLIQTILGQAEGVFLWVSLVTRSICNGLLSDEWDTLLERVKQLPSDLSDLYQDMWNRMNKDDQQLYQYVSASYFSLVLERPAGRGPTLFEMMLSTKPDIRRTFLAGCPDIDEDYLFRQLNISRRQIQIRCAGLLDVREVQNLSLQYERSIEFIHRSAHDFIQDTQVGKQIVRCDKNGPRHLILWAQVANLLRYSMTRPTADTHPIMNRLIDTLRNFHDLFTKKNPSFMLSAVALTESIFERSLWWTNVFKEFPLVNILASAGFYRYIQYRTQNLSLSIPQDRKILDEFLWYGSLAFYQSLRDGEISDSQVLNDVIPAIHLLLDSGANVNFQAARFHHPWRRLGSSLVLFLEALSFSIESDVLVELLQLLYKIIDSGVDLEIPALINIGSWYPLEQIPYISVDQGYPQGCQVLARVNTRDILLYQHTAAVEEISSNKASIPHRGKLRALESVTLLQVKVVLVIAEYTENHSREWKAFSNTAHTARIFEEINQKYQTPTGISSSDWDVWHSQLMSLSSCFFTEYEDVLQFLVNEALISKDADLWAKKHSAEDLLTIKRRPFKLHNAVAEMDWSYKPEYDQFVAVVDETFEERE